MLLLLVLTAGPLGVLAVLVTLIGKMTWLLALLILASVGATIVTPPLIWQILFPEISDPYEPLIETPWDKR